MARQTLSFFKKPCALLSLLVHLSAADFNLQPVPTTGCIGHPDGTASFTSSTSVPTGELLVNPGAGWNQAGATWQWILNSPGLIWDSVGIPGYGADGNIPAAAESAFKLSPDKSTVSWVVPPSDIGGGWEVVAIGTPASKAASSTPTSAASATPTWKAGACTLSAFTDHPVTCSGSVQKPLVPTTTVCACPSSVLMDPETNGSGKPDCAQYTNAQGDLLVVTNACTTSAKSKVKRTAAAALDPRHPEITPMPDSLLTGAKFRAVRRDKEERLDKRASGGSMEIIFKGSTPCGGASPTGSSSSVSGNSNIASSCSNDEITAGPAAFSTYEVRSYMSSLLNAAEPAAAKATPTDPVDGVAVIQSDVNPEGAKCTYTAKCDSISCSSVKDSDDGLLLSVQRFVAYQTIVNFNNYLWSIQQAVYEASEITGLMSADIVKDFYTDPTPDATWEQIVGLLTPFLSVLSSALGPISGEASAAFGVVSGLLGEATAGGTVAQLTAVSEASFNEYGTISNYVAAYLKGTLAAVEQCYDSTIGSKTPTFEWTGSPVAPTDQQTGLFGTGAFSNSDYAQSLTTNVKTQMAKIISYKAINYALVDSSNFIIYVPYGTPVMDASGNMIQGGINQDYCENKLHDESNLGTILVCDAPGGMARIFNAGAASDATVLEGSKPMGYDSNLQIVPGENFNMGDAIKGSVASFQTGGFGYDVSDPYSAQLKTGGDGLSTEQLTAIGKIQVSQSAPGFFNIPVCKILDLRAFPAASGLGCLACPEAFAKNASSQINTILGSPPNQDQCNEGTCAQVVCNFTPYTG